MLLLRSAFFNLCSQNAWAAVPSSAAELLSSGNSDPSIALGVQFSQRCDPEGESVFTHFPTPPLLQEVPYTVLGRYLTVWCRRIL